MEPGSSDIPTEANLPGSLNYLSRNENQASKVVFRGFTKRHLLLIGLYGLGNVFRGGIVLIAGPLFPPEVSADKRSTYQ
jgi:hypothetical protein